MLGFGDYKQDTTASTVKQRDYKDSTDLVVNDSEVRRLTPRECERLMGWPDDHTRYDDKGNELSDSARYKMCGNGIASPVAQWIGENIVEAYNE
jgi:DNA (cytosine-5)-methyltransferase 1